MKIKWLGHSCFLLTSENGIRILTDPFNEEVAFPPPQVEADIVTVSHQHFDHNNTSVVLGNFVTFDQPGSFEHNGIELKGVSSFHDKCGGSARGSNILFRMVIDGLSIVHSGDLGHLLDNHQVQELGRVDILLLPVGGFFTIDAKEAAMVVKQLKPTLTIPMHFKTGDLDFPIEGIDPFLSEMGGGKRAGSQEVQVTGDRLKDMAGVLVLDTPE